MWNPQKEKIAYTREYMCQCWDCKDREDYEEGDLLELRPGSCAKSNRLDLHTIQVCKIDMASSALVTLIIGPHGAKIVAPRAVLAFYSRFFDAAFYGNFKESKVDFLELPEDDDESINTFVAWAKTGQIYSTLELEELWALGTRLQSDLFTNEVMYYMFGRAVAKPLSANNAQLAYSLSLPGSKLRAYIRRLIVTEGPLKKGWLGTRNDKVRAWCEEWGRLIREGGDLVYDIVVEEEASFYQLADDISDRPYYYENQDDYLQDDSQVSVEGFIEAKCKEGKF
ncbi:hypothetical protein ACEPPN_004475 [Leptodophora sp. 'Broadleaf-Isolate-01']